MGWRVALTDKAETDLEAAVAFLAGFSREAAERIGCLRLTALGGRGFTPQLNAQQLATKRHEDAQKMMLGGGLSSPFDKLRTQSRSRGS